MAKKRQVKEQPNVALIYLRVSTKEQLENLSMEVQESRCREWCRGRGIEIARIFHDDGVSARTVLRPSFQEMLAFIKSKRGAVGYVVVHDLSRFARNMENQIEVMSELRSVGTLLRSVMEELDETAAGNMIANMHGLMNQFFSDRNAERTRVGMEKSARIGRFPFKAPLGYLNVRATRDSANLIPDPERAPLVRKGFELYASGTMSRAELLRQLTNLGLRTQAGKKLTAQTLEKLLRNPAFAGWVEIPSWGVKNRGTWEPLVSQELFDRVQDIMDGKRIAVVPHIRNNEDFPLRVFVRCGACGTPLAGSWNKGRSKRYPNYRCRNANCKAVHIRKEALERQFLHFLHRMTPSEDFRLLFHDIVIESWNRKQAEAQAQVSGIRLRLSALTGRKNTLVDKYLDGKVTEQTYGEQVERLSGEIAEATAALREAERADEQVEDLLIFADRLLSDPAGIWTRASLDMRQRLQTVLFPSGLTYSQNEGFGTGQTPSFFSLLAAMETENTTLASPTGFEPVLPP
jgi:site-specific DNA recombinase